MPKGVIFYAILHAKTKITKSRIVWINLTGVGVLSIFHYPPFVACICNTGVQSWEQPESFSALPFEKNKKTFLYIKISANEVWKMLNSLFPSVHSNAPYIVHRTFTIHCWNMWTWKTFKNHTTLKTWHLHFELFLHWHCVNLPVWYSQGSHQQGRNIQLLAFPWSWRGSHSFHSDLWVWNSVA